jgi:hypothetical protein
MSISLYNLYVQNLTPVVMGIWGWEF